MKYFRNIILMHLLFLSSMSQAQQAKWQWIQRAGGVGTHGTVGADDRVYDMAVDEEGNVYVCGSIYDSFFSTFDTTWVKTYGKIDMFVAKYSCDGELLWVKVGGNRQGGDLARSISVDTTRKVVYMSGRIRSNSTDRFMFSTDTTITSPHNDMFLMQLDYEGNINWLFMGESSSGGLYNSIDSSGNIYVTFSISQIPNGEFAPGYNLNSGYHLAKFDPNGNILFIDSIWDKGIVSLTGLVSDTEGNTYICGYFKDTAIIGGQQLVTTSILGDMYLMKYNNQGDFQWLKRSVSDDSAGIEFALAQSIAISSDGKQISIAGYGLDGTKFGNFEINNTLDLATSAFVVTYDNSGTVKWMRNSSNLSGANAFGTAINNKNEVFMSGILRGPTKFNLATYTSEGQGDIFVVGYRPDGTVLSEHILKGSGDQTDIGYTLESGYNGNFYLGGSFGTDIKISDDTVYSTGGLSDILVAKFGIEECLDTTSADTSDSTGIFNILSTQTLPLKIFPNPSHGTFTIQFQNRIENADLTIYDAMVRVVYNQSNITKNVQDNLTLNTNLNPGVYVVVLREKDMVYRERIIVK